MSHASTNADTRANRRTDTDAGGGDRHRAGLFDIRTFIAALIGIYGVVLVIMGLVNSSGAEVAKSDGVNINLWTGIGLIVAAAVFQVWAMKRPVVVPDHVEDRDESDEERRVNEG